MSMLEELWLGGLDYQGRPVKKGSAMERKMYLYARNAEKMKGMLTGPQAEQYEKTIDAFNDVLTQSEIEAYEFGFTLAVRLMMDVMQTMEIPSIDEV